MIVTAGSEDVVTFGIGEDHGGVSAPAQGLDHADRNQLESGRFDQGRVGLLEPVRRNGQGEHVVLAAGRGEWQRLDLRGGGDLPHARDHGNRFSLQPDHHTRRHSNVAKIGAEPITYVDHRRGAGPGQDRRCGQLRLGPDLTLDQEVAGQLGELPGFQAVQQPEPGSRASDRAGNGDNVTRAGAGPADHRGSIVDVGDHGDAEEDDGRGNDVPAGQLKSELCGCVDHSVDQAFQVFVRRFGRSTESHEDLGVSRTETHGGEVGDRRRHRLAGALGRRALTVKVDSFDRGVDRCDDPSPGPDNRRVIADPGLDPSGSSRLRGNPADQLELAQVHGSDTIAPQMREESDKPSLLHRLGHLAATVGKTGPKKKSTKIILQGSIAFLIFGFLVFTVVTQWSELKEKGVEFDFIWLIPAVLMMLLYYIAGAAVWGLILRFLGSPVPAMETQKIWAQPLLVRYIPGTVLFLLARILMAEKAGVQRRVTTAGIVYEQAVSIAGALTIATWFLIDHPDLQSQPARWLPLLILPAMVLLLHPLVFGPISKRLLHALGRESLPQLMPFRGVVVIYLAYVVVWAIMGVGVFFAARAVHHLNLDDLAIVAASQMIGFLAAVISAVTPAGLGVRDAAFAWAVKVALPSDSFGVGAVIAIAVRATQTVVELIYVGAVTALTRREGDEGEIELAEEAAEEAARLESSGS